MQCSMWQNRSGMAEQGKRIFIGEAKMSHNTCNLHLEATDRLKSEKNLSTEESTGLQTRGNITHAFTLGTSSSYTDYGPADSCLQ